MCGPHTLPSHVRSLEQQLAIVSEQLGSATLETRQVLSFGAAMWAGPSGSHAVGHGSADDAADADEGEAGGEEAAVGAVQVGEGHAATSSLGALHPHAIQEGDEGEAGEAGGERGAAEPPPSGWVRLKHSMRVTALLQHQAAAPHCL